MQETGQLNLSMFKAYDIRTKSKKLNLTLVNRLIRAIGRYYIEVLNCNKVVIARDTRLSAPVIMQTALDYFISIGIDVVINPSQISTCQFYYSCMQNTDAAGIMITASHNPGEYIGFKLMAPGVQTLATDCGPLGGIACIKKFYIEDIAFKALDREARIIIKRYTSDFIDYSMKLSNVKEGDLKGANILVDFLSGVAGTEIGEALTRCGAKVTMRNLIPNGNFPSGDPNPVVLSSIKPTWDAMKKGNFDFGFCFDGDGDRLDIMNSKGIQIAPSFNMTLILPEIDKIYKKAFSEKVFTDDVWYPHIYSDVKANPLCMHNQSELNTKVHIIRNGHSFIKEALRTNFKSQYIAASEESAHYYFNCPLEIENPKKGFVATENTLFFALITAKKWNQDRKSYEDILERQNSLCRIREWPCHFLDESKMEEIMERVEKVFRDKGLSVLKEMEDSSSLDATLMRYNLPLIIDENTDMSGDWYQIAQRISRSEEGMTRWEIVSNKTELARDANSIVRKITDEYVQAGYAEYLD